MTIIDYSVSRPSISVLKAANVTAVGRYIGWDSVPGYSSIGKNITKAEADSLLAAGIDIFLAFEYLADASAKGSSQGTLDGNLAFQQLSELGAPPGMAVYFAVDFDIPDYDPSVPDTAANAMLKLGPVGHYFEAVKNLRHPYEIGVYGGYYACKRVLNANLATKAWQTIAWSGGQIDSRAVLYQITATAPIIGADIDIREHASSGNFGEWTPTSISPITSLTPAQMGAIMGALPVLSQGMTDSQFPVEFIHRLQAILKDVYGYAVVINGTYDVATVVGVKEIQARYGLVQDGICGPLTWAPIITGSKA